MPTLESLTKIAATNQWGALAPEIGLIILALVILMADVFAGPARARIVALGALLGQVVILAFTLVGQSSATSGPLFGGLLTVSAWGNLWRVFFQFAGLIAGVLGVLHLDRRHLPRGEFHALIAIVTAGLMLLAQSTHFVLVFIALETVTISFYILVAYARQSTFSLEAGLKYLVQGGLSSALLLFGMVLLYGAAGNPGLKGNVADGLDFVQLGSFLKLNATHPLVLAGAALVLCGAAFKGGLFPFQVWIADVYQGAPTPTTAFLSTASKAGGFVMLINLLKGPFAPLAATLAPVLLVIAIATLLFGNIAALPQFNVKRILAWSGVSHAGFLLAGICAMVKTGDFSYQGTIVFYFFTYLFASAAVFGVLNALQVKDDAQPELNDFHNLLKRHPFHGSVLIIGLGSLAGVPPLAGFIAKFLIFRLVLDAQLYGLLAVAALGVALSMYYYFGWIGSIARHILPWPVKGGAENEPVVQDSVLSRVFLASAAILTVVLGLYQGVFSSVLG